MRFELTRAEPIELAVQRLNHSATSSPLWLFFWQNNFFLNQVNTDNHFYKISLLYAKNVHNFWYVHKMFDSYSQ